MVKGLAGLLGLAFRRIQFTPDLLPSDITGAGVLQEVDGKRELTFVPGNFIFGNLILADEINRASPRTQSAMLEAMQEQRVSVMGDTHRLPDPFWCMATQNQLIWRDLSSSRSTTGPISIQTSRDQSIGFGIEYNYSIKTSWSRSGVQSVFASGELNGCLDWLRRYFYPQRLPI